MQDSLTAIELLLALGCGVITGYELYGVLAARREGLSRNVSRVVTHAAMLAMLVGYAWVAWSDPFPESIETGFDPASLPPFNVPLLLIGVMLTLVAVWEILSMLDARRKGLTRNVSRLVNHVVVTLLLAAMIGLSVLKWDLQMDRLESTYIGDVPQGRPGD